jgi:hypothetical protein
MEESKRVGLVEAYQEARDLYWQALCDIRISSSEMGQIVRDLVTKRDEMTRLANNEGKSFREMFPELDLRKQGKVDCDVVQGN